MGQDWKIINLDKCEQGPTLGYKFSSDMEHPQTGLMKLLAAPRDPTPELPLKWVIAPDASRVDDLGTLGVLPPELVGFVFRQLDDLEDIACFAVSHRILLQHGYPYLVRARSWSGDRIIFVGEYLEAIPERMLISETEKEEFKAISESEACTLSQWLLETYREPQSRSSITMGSSFWTYRRFRRTRRALRDSTPEEDFRTALDCARIDAAVRESSTQPCYQGSKHISNLAICNWTKRAFVRGEQIARIQRDPEDDSRGFADLGHVAVFMTACSDDMSSATPWNGGDWEVLYEKLRGKMGAWAGERLSIIEVDRLEADMEDDSVEIASLMRLWYQANDW
ncbi:unnamed protein product [Peniophora sp. CBMAI 1063]|nr:unnamed protein product [Peniophora sp. CBMAI 1063]